MIPPRCVFSTTTAVVVGCAVIVGGRSVRAQPQQTLLDNLNGKLLRLLDKTELTDNLEGEGPFTVFMPTAKALKRYFGREVFKKNAVIANDDLEEMKTILNYHILMDRKITSSDFEADARFPDFQAFYDGVVVEPFKTLTKKSKGTVNRSVQLLETDVEASNGVIHVINQVLVPFYWKKDTFPTPIARLNYEVSVSEMAKLIQAAELELPEEYTILAPTDKAIKKSRRQGVTITDEVLKYHILLGKINMFGLEDGAVLETLEGSTIQVTIPEPLADAGLVVKINPEKSEVMETFESTNGYLVFISKVLSL